MSVRWRQQFKKEARHVIVEDNLATPLEGREPHYSIATMIFDEFEELYPLIWTDFSSMEIKVFAKPEQEPPDILLTFTLHFSMPTIIVTDVVVNPKSQGQGYGTLIFRIIQKVPPLTGRSVMTWTKTDAVKHILDRLGWDVVMKETDEIFVYVCKATEETPT